MYAFWVCIGPPKAEVIERSGSHVRGKVKVASDCHILNDAKFALFI